MGGRREPLSQSPVAAARALPRSQSIPVHSTATTKNAVTTILTLHMLPECIQGSVAAFLVTLARLRSRVNLFKSCTGISQVFRLADQRIRPFLGEVFFFIFPKIQIIYSFMSINYCFHIKISYENMCL